MSVSTQIGIFAKYWEPGKVKTRLAASVGDQLAAQFHQASLSALLGELADFPARRVLAYTPRDQRARFAELSGDRWELVPQIAGDLGLRMRHYFDRAFASGARRVVLIGSDSPQLRSAAIAGALDALEKVPLTLGPSEDGGYYLIAGRPDMPDVFEGVDWGTSQVWLQTLALVEASGVPWLSLEPTFDVDELSDVKKLLAALTEAAQTTAPQRRLTEVCQRCLDL